MFRKRLGVKSVEESWGGRGEETQTVNDDLLTISNVETRVSGIERTILIIVGENHPGSRWVDRPIPPTNHF